MSEILKRHSNLFSLFASLADDIEMYSWPTNGALSHAVCSWLQFDSTWRKQAAKAGTLQMPVSHANYLDERDAHSLPAWWAAGGREEYLAYKATWGASPS